jgi:hypothetical protein
MSITLDGTSGINNDATNLNYTGTLTGGTGVVNLGSGQFYKDASGNVGIGTTNPRMGLHLAFSGGNTVYGGLDGNTNGFFLRNNIYYDAVNERQQPIVNGFQTEIQMRNQDGSLRFSTSTSSNNVGDAATSTERMRIDSSGNLLVGGTATEAADSCTIFNFGAVSARRTSDLAGVFRRDSTNGNVVQFRRDATTVGNISVTTTATTYATSSDYRLKHDIQPMTGALAKVQALKPCTYKWNADDSAGEGFIAHELQEVCPSAVTGEKDAVDAEGNPQYQGIDSSFLVATLTAAIQEQQQLITALTARVEALEAQNV